MTLRSVGQYAAIAGVAVVIGSLAFEAHVRLDLRDRFYDSDTLMFVLNQTLTPSEADNLLGYRTQTHPLGLFKPDETFQIAIIQNIDVVFRASARTNNMGFLSDKTYAVARDAERPEFRVVVLGDSMTGTTTADQQWVDSAEDMLNGSPVLRDHLGAKTVRLYNLGWPGAGFEHFWSAFDTKGRQFDPDLVVINFIIDDLPRTLSGMHLTEDAAMIAQTGDVMAQFAEIGIPLLIALVPRYGDAVASTSDHPVLAAVASRFPELPITIMRDRMPFHRGDAEERSWYNLPHDGHFSEQGGEIYACALTGLIVEALTGVAPAGPDASCPKHALEAIADEIRSGSRNLLANGDFATWGPEPMVAVLPEPVALAPTWTALADGVGGAGRGRVSRLETSDLPDRPSDTPVPVLRYEQTSRADSGSPSVAVIVGPVADLAGRDILVSFHARAAADRTFQILLYQNFGTGGRPSPEVNFLAVDFDAAPGWKRFTFLVAVPVLAGQALGSNGDDHLRLTIIPKLSTDNFVLDIADVQIYLDVGGVAAALESTETREPDPMATTSGLLDSRDKIALLRQRIIEQFAAARTFNWFRSYGYYRLIGKETPFGGHYSPANKHTGGFVAIEYGQAPDEVAYLNVVCTSGPVSLGNPDCFHFYAIFAR